MRVSKKSTLSWTEVPLAENRNRFSDCTPLPPVPPTPLENRIKWRFSPTRCFSAAHVTGKTKCVAHATQIIKYRFIDRLKTGASRFLFSVLFILFLPRQTCRYLRKEVFCIGCRLDIIGAVLVYDILCVKNVALRRCVR